jgi:hypothetical protein
VAASVHADTPHTAEPVTLNSNPMHHSRGRQLSLDTIKAHSYATGHKKSLVMSLSLLTSTLYRLAC